jgi:hypothetical protein
VVLGTGASLPGPSLSRHPKFASAEVRGRAGHRYAREHEGINVLSLRALHILCLPSGGTGLRYFAWRSVRQCSTM